MTEEYYAGDVPFRRHPIQILLFSPAKKRLIAAVAGAITTFDTKSGNVIAKYKAPHVGRQIHNSGYSEEQPSVLAEVGQETEDTGEYGVLGTILYQF